MKTLNLVYPEKSDIKYHDGLGNIGKTAKFPDGQQNIVILGVIDEKGDKPSLNWWETDKIQIKSRLNNWLDLELIVCAVAALRELGVEEIHLYVPYIIGARSDRKFQEGGNNYIKDVIAPIINSLNFKSVTCIDPHSDVLEACIKGFRKESNYNLLMYSLHEIYNTHSHIARDKNNFILVSPDAGASKKIYKLAEQIGYKGDIITCGKERDTEGKLTKTIVPLDHLYVKTEHLQKDLIIIDDICDGGNTFINIAKRVKECSYKGKIYLIVTHGIFSKGFKELSQYFDGIYCTNSYGNIEFGPPLEKNGFCVKQLNVF